MLRDGAAVAQGPIQKGFVIMAFAAVGAAFTWHRILWVSLTADVIAVGVEE